MLVSLKRVKKKHRLFERVGKGFYINKDFSFDKWFLRQYYGYNVEDSYVKILSHLKEHGLRSFGVADSIEQVKEYYKELEASPEKFIVIMTPVYRKNESSYGGFRFHKWGRYIGEHALKHEYFYDHKDMDVIYTFRVLMVNSSGHRPARREHIKRVKSLLN